MGKPIDVMIALAPERVAQLAAVTRAASTDEAREVLGALELAWHTDKAGTVTVTAVCTDSYMLARRTFTFDKDDPSIEVSPKQGSVTIADCRKGFYKALQEQYRAAKKRIGPEELKATLIALDDDGATIVAGDESAVTMHGYVDGAFPKYEALLAANRHEYGYGLAELTKELRRELTALAADSRDATEDHARRLAEDALTRLLDVTEPGKVTLPAFNPQLVTQLVTSIAEPPSARTAPMKWAGPDEAKDTALKPWAATVTQRRESAFAPATEWLGLIMPVRV